MLTCAILAGGFGSRMLPRTAYVPKVLVPVAGRPFLDHQVSWLRAQRVTQVFLGMLGNQGRRGCLATK